MFGTVVRDLKMVLPVQWYAFLRRLWHFWHNLWIERQYLYYKGLSPDQFEKALKKWYKKYTGETLNLENPQTFNEKIQWLKLNDSNPLKARLSDKYLAREWVAEKIGAEHLVPLLGVYDKFDDIDFSALPNKFVIKTNHDGGSIWFVKDKSKFNVSRARDYFNERMRINDAFRSWLEPCYKYIIPKVLVEEYLENSDNDLYDYIIRCFGGKVKFIQFSAHTERKSRITFFDREWHPLPFSIGFHKYEEHVEKPDNLEQMINLAENLAEGFTYVRVDLFRLNDGTIKFGEMLFSPDCLPYKWDPPEYDKIFGDLIKLPIDKK